MRCNDCRDALDLYVDNELAPGEMADVREHLAQCAECQSAHREIVATSRAMRAHLVRYAAPDVLRARIRNAIAEEATRDERPALRRWPWMQLVAAGVVIAAASSALTFAAIRYESPSAQLTSTVVASHIHSLVPGHLTDVQSTNTHNVKPWFNGRVDLSPLVPNLDSLGFPLLGGRVDYIGTHQAAVVVYGRRQHVINVYSWTAGDRQTRDPVTSSDKGFHVVHWTSDGIESWVVSDLNAQEIDQFVRLLRTVR